MINTAANPRHSIKSSSWYTPGYILDAVRAVLGTIDLAPCSSPEANQGVQADYVMSFEENGLIRAWFKRPQDDTEYFEHVCRLNTLGAVMLPASYLD